ncbi:MAG: hypothetical protein HY265_06710 [Deltaproteobacteria bacterium]|nr:hypothetical protein [Deltaproteobacteria bacterium]
MLRLIIILVFLQFTAASLFAQDIEAPKKEATENKRVSFEYELDAYYSNIGLYVALTDTPIPDAGEKAEIEIYRDLLFSSYIPRFLVLEAAVFPMPELGVMIKKDSPDVYKSGEITNDLNLVKAITAGFDEPYSLSLFLGNVVSFSRPGEKHKQGNFGYMGYLVSTGNYNIHDNVLIRDDWYELEWKIKGDRKFPTHDLHWSFRAGVKMHNNPNIKDVLYVSLRRSRLDFEASPYSIIDNSGFEYIYDMDSKTLKPVRHSFIVDKKWPLKEEQIGFSMALGFIWEAKERYSGPLATRADKDNFQIVIRPNIQF